MTNCSGEEKSPNHDYRKRKRKWKVMCDKMIDLNLAEIILFRANVIKDRNKLESFMNKKRDELGKAKKERKPY